MDFESFIKGLAPLSVHQREGWNEAEAEGVAQALVRMPGEITREGLADLLRQNPSWLPLLALSVGLTQEALKNQMKHRFGTSSWSRLVRENAEGVIAYLDETYRLCQSLEEERKRNWTLADVLKERLRWSRRQAIRATIRGRIVEDSVEKIIQKLGLPYRMRTQFQGRGGVVPCDFAILKDGNEPVIVGAAKGFDSTGSKLTDAVREIQSLAQNRWPKQFVFVIIDGIGWLNRKSDLKRVWDLKQTGQIDGLYTLSQMSAFEEALREASQRYGLLP